MPTNPPRRLTRLCSPNRPRLPHRSPLRISRRPGGLPARSGPAAPAGIQAADAPVAGSTKNPEKGRSKLSVVLIVLAVLVGACTAGLGITWFAVKDDIEAAVDDFQESQARALTEVSLDKNSCRIENGKGAVDVNVDNTTDSDSDYTISIRWTTDTGDESTGDIRMPAVHPQNRATGLARSDDALEGNEVTCEITGVLRLGSR